MFGYDQQSFKKDRMIPVLKTPRGGESQVTLTSEGTVQVVQHFLDRSYVCPGSDTCPACEIQIPSRGYTYAVGVVNNIHYLVSLPGDYPPCHSKPGQQIFLVRARRNNQLKFQIGLFKSDIEPDCTVDDVWNFVLRVYKVRVDGVIDSTDSECCRKIKAAAMACIERACVQHVGKR